MALLSKTDILKIDDLPRHTVPVPEWDGEVLVRMLTARERDLFEQETFGGEEGRNLLNLRARLVGLCLVDEDGNRLFEDEEISTLGEKSAAALDRVFKVAQKINAMATASVGDAEKN